MREIEDQAGFISDVVNCMSEEQRQKWLEVFGSKNTEILCDYKFIIFDTSEDKGE